MDQILKENNVQQVDFSIKHTVLTFNFFFKNTIRQF
jgi:hypothetical protein